MEFFLHNSNQHIGGHGAPNLCLHRALPGIHESLDVQVLLDSFEQEFVTLALVLECDDGERRQHSTVREKDQRVASFGNPAAEASEGFG